MKDILRGVFVLTLVISLIFLLPFSLSGARNPDIAEISKIMINEQGQEETQDLNRYEAIEGETNKYLRFPQVRRGDVLSRGDGLETFEQIAARIDFTAEQFLLLGTGTERMIDCAKVTEGKSCAMARFDGFTNGTPFWYIKKGVAVLKDMLVHDDRAEVVELIGTEYYFNSNKAATIVIVLDGAVRVKAKDAPGEVIVREGQQTEVFSAATPPTLPVQVSSEVLNDIYGWRKNGLIVIHEPRTGTKTKQPSIQLSGTVSDRNAREVRLFINDRGTEPIPVINGEFAKEISLLEGKNIVKVQTSTQYGESSDSISVIRRASQRGQTIRVPNVVGKREEDAARFLRRERFTVNITREETGRGRAGTVIRQDPPPDTRVQLGSAIALIVEEGEEVIDVVNKSEKEAIRLLSQRGFRVSISREETGRGSVGTVIRQNPLPGALAKRGSSIDLVVEAKKEGPVVDIREEEPVQAPNVLGLRENEARKRLQEAGLRVESTERLTCRTEAGKVIEQSPSPNTRVKRGSSVNLAVENGSQVPGVLGMSEEDAKNLLRQRQFSVKRTEEKFTCKNQVGEVIGQSLTPNACAKQGSLITLEVEQGVRVPEVVNQSEASATSLLRQRKFSVKRDEETACKTEVGKVIRQSPTPNACVKQGSSITLRVEKGSRVPPVLKETKKDAESLLEKAGFKVRSTDEVTCEGEVGTVIRQSQSPNACVKQGSSITLGIENGSRVPNVLNRREENAKSRLDQQGFNVGKITRQSTGRGSVGTVVQQSPSPNTCEKGGNSVTLVVEAEPTPVEVPDVICKSEEEAKDLLKSRGLKVDVQGAWSGGECPGYCPPYGTVVDQRPSANTSVRSGSSVTIYVCVEPT